MVLRNLTLSWASLVIGKNGETVVENYDFAVLPCLSNQTYSNIYVVLCNVFRTGLASELEEGSVHGLTRVQLFLYLQPEKSYMNLK